MTNLVDTKSSSIPKQKSGRRVRPWLVSLTLHTLGILFLALWVAPNLRGPQVESLQAKLSAPEVALLDLPITIPDTPLDTSDAIIPRETVTTITSVLEVKPIHLALGSSPRSPLPALPELLPPRFEPAELLPGVRMPGSNVASDLSQVRSANGVADAAEAVTGAIRGEVEKGDRLVVWLLDASISLEQNRSLLAARAADFYQSMDAFNTSREDYSGRYALLSSVVAFGRGWNEIMRPNRMGARAMEKMTQVPIDRSGIENVMAAVTGTIRLYRDRRHRKDRIVMVILTDESGDDIRQLERTIEMCHEEDVVVHVLGPSAVMGCQKGSQLCQIPQGNRTYPFWLTVNKGPETSLPERFLLPYWHESTIPPWQQGGASASKLEWYGGSYRERLPSGFGPYALTRLALQTGGSFTMFEPLPMQADYDHELLRDYVPDYGSADEYLASIKGRPLRQFVANAAAMTFKQPQLFTAPRLTFMGRRSPYYPYEVENYYFSPADFRDQLALTLNQQRSHVAQAVNALAPFVAQLAGQQVDWEYEYTKEESKRWRAWYDLTKGRLLATQARYLEYLRTSQEVQNTISPLTNKVTLHPGSGLRDTNAQALAEEATKVLRRCQHQNAGTPWEDLAKWELDKPIGLRIEQGQIPKPPPRTVGGSTGSPQKFSFPKL